MIISADNEPNARRKQRCKFDAPPLAAGFLAFAGNSILNLAENRLLDDIE